MLKTYAWFILRTLDLFWATIIWKKYNITISAWTGLAMRKPKPPYWARRLSNFLNHIQLNHCEIAIQDDLAIAKETISILGA